MVRDPTTRSTLVGSVLLLALTLAACAGPPPVVNTPPTLDAVADRTVARNTLTPPTLTIDLIVADPDSDTLIVTADSDTPEAIPDSALTCAPGACTLTLTPSVDASAEVAITLTVDDGDGGSASDTFGVSIVPAQVVALATDSGEGSLRRAIADAAPGDVIGFDEGVFALPRVVTLTTPLTLSKDVTIEGPGRDQLTLSGGNVSRVLIVEASAIATVSGVTIADGVSSTGPLVRGAAGSVAAFTDDLAGGGVVVDVASALTLLDSRVMDSGAVFGGGIYNLGTLTVRRSAIEGNFADISGGGIYTAEGGSTTVAESDLSDNRADGTLSEDEGGGALLNDRGTLLVTEGSRLFDNTATISGGAILNLGGDLIVDGGVELFANQADEGGAIFQAGDGAAALVSDSTVGGPLPEHANSAVRGGGIYQYDDASTFVIDGVTVQGNQAVERGGGIYHESPLPMTVRSSVVIGNAVTGPGGGFYHVHDLILEATTVGGTTPGDGNEATDGGGIYSNRDLLVLAEGSAVIGNRASGNGGGIYAEVGTLALSDSTIAGNRADGSGGGIYIEDPDPGDANAPSTTLSNVVVGDLDPTDGNDLSNSAISGGGIYVEAGTLELLASTVVAGNVAGSDGGGIYLLAGEVDLDDAEPGGGVRVRDNAARFGGGLHIFDGSVTLHPGAAVSGNSAEVVGGGVYNAGTLLISGAIVGDPDLGDALDEGNSAPQGGGIYTIDTLEIEGGGRVQGNIASEAPGGGGVFKEGGVLVGVTCIEVVDNTPDDLLDGVTVLCP